MGRKDYGNDEIVVHWGSSRCIHTGICTRELPTVFDVTKRPWIDVNGADADAVAATTGHCPTGALRSGRLDGRDWDPAAAVTTVVPIRNRPLYLSGPLRVTAPDSPVLDEETRLALCRCGATANSHSATTRTARSGSVSRSGRARGR